MKNKWQQHLEIKRLMLSVDFDSVTDFLFKSAMEEGIYKQLLTPKGQKKFPGLIACILGIRAALEEFFSEMTEEIDHVELFVGSLRQCRQTDFQLYTVNKNGLCNELLADYADKNGWTYNKLLLADILNKEGKLRNPPLKPGTAMGAFIKDKEGRHRHATSLQEVSIHGPEDKEKKNILKYQILHAKELYPLNEITYVFIDDQIDIINGLMEFFNAPEQKELLSGLKALKLFHLDTDKLFTYTSKQVDVETMKEHAKSVLTLKYHFQEPQKHQSRFFSSISPRDTKTNPGIFSNFDPFPTLFLSLSCYFILIYLTCFILKMQCVGQHPAPKHTVEFSF